MAAVTLKNLDKSFRPGKRQTIRAVRGVSLVVEDGEFLVLVGPSGCGKSTLLRLIAGLEDPDAGAVLIGDRDVTRFAPKDRDVAMVFQNYALYPHMTAGENMAFGLKLRKVPRKERESKVAEAARQLGIAELLPRHPGELSGGQRQRVALGRALVRDPKVFLFDEPLSNLDAQVRLQIRAEIAQLHRRLRTTMVYVTHDQAEAMTLGDRIAVMKDGVLQQVGRPLEIYDHPVNKFVAGFLGEPPMNFLHGTVIANNDRWRWVENDAQGHPALRGFAVPLNGRLDPETLAAHRNLPVWLGLRPEHVEINSGAGEDLGVAEVDFEEHLGAESWCHLKTRHHRLTVRRAARDPLTGEVRVFVAPERMTFFGADEGALAPAAIPTTP